MRLFLIALTAAFAVWMPRAPAAGSEVPYIPAATRPVCQAILILSP